MIKALFEFCRRFFTSRIGQALFVIHLVLVIYAFAQNPVEANIPCEYRPSSMIYIAGRSFHWTNESALLQLVSLLDLPAIFVASIFSTSFLPFALCQTTMSWIEGIAVLICASFQWQLVGFWIEGFVRSIRDRQ